MRQKNKNGTGEGKEISNKTYFNKAGKPISIKDKCHEMLSNVVEKC